MLIREQVIQFNEIFDELANNLDITETQYDAAVNSYQAVGTWLSKEDSPLAPFKPAILPQGSFMLGTMIKPAAEGCDLDIDLVCQLTGKRPQWTQYHLKQVVGNRLKDNAMYKQMLDDEGRRCWTLLYRQDTDKMKERYHMDILPSIVGDGYQILLEKAFSSFDSDEQDKLAIRITCNEEENYYTETDPSLWLKSNPFGYGKWFFDRASLSIEKAMSLRESIEPVPKYQKKKLPLQRVVQILKWHRDLMFKDQKHKPISIIITTLASRAYNKETDIVTALRNVIDRMPLYVEDYYSREQNKVIKWVGNPVNEKENFADRWLNPEYGEQRQKNFYKWLDKVKTDVNLIISQRGTQNLTESLSKAFGQKQAYQTFSAIGDKARILTESGQNRFDVKSGIVAGAANTIKPHNFYGK